MTAQTSLVPRAFIWRRLHSLMGLWLVLFLIEHLLVNSQAALLLGENGKGFVEMVNSIHNLPYLQAIEIALLGIPILIHLVLGIKYLFTAKSNSFHSKGNKPSLPEYGRNKAYTWQRITSWILVVLLAGHIVKFRFLEYPDSLTQGKKSSYFVRVDLDNGLYTVAARLGAALYDRGAIEKERSQIKEREIEEALVDAANSLRGKEGVLENSRSVPYNSQTAMILSAAQTFQEKCAWVEALEKKPLSENQVVAVADNFGTASLLVVRDTFKNPIYVVLYTIFVCAASFHAFNGFWTFLMTWGAILKMSAQKAMATFSVALMILIAFLGLAAIWGTYWLNLRF